MTFEKILVPYDGSKFSEKAFRQALEIANKFDSVITIITVITIPHDIREFTLEFAEELSNKQTKHFQELTNILIQKAKDNHIKCSQKFVFDPSPVGGIINYMTSQKFDLIIIGAHGRTGFTKLLLGSVADGILKHAKCPVMIIK